jgi:copper chaperone CopZ
VQALKKLPGVKSAMVDFKNGKVDIAWKADKPFDYEAVRRATGKTANFTLRAVELTVVGEVERAGESTVLKATGTGDLFILKGLPTLSDRGPYEVTGKLTSPSGSRQGKKEEPKAAMLPQTLQVEAHRSATPSR